MCIQFDSLRMCIESTSQRASCESAFIVFFWTPVFDIAWCTITYLYIIIHIGLSTSSSTAMSEQKTETDDGNNAGERIYNAKLIANPWSLLGETFKFGQQDLKCIYLLRCMENMPMWWAMWKQRVMNYKFFRVVSLFCWGLCYAYALPMHAYKCIATLLLHMHTAHTEQKWSRLIIVLIGRLIYTVCNTVIMAYACLLTWSTPTFTGSHHWAALVWACGSKAHAWPENKEACLHSLQRIMNL